MPFILMHKTNPKWEAGEKPTPELIARVGALIGELAKTNKLLAGEGLRASSLGARVRGATVTKGPLVGENELPAGFTIVRAKSLDEAIELARKAFGDAEVDVRPVTEAWDIGIAEKPEGLTSERFMLQRKADAATEAGAPVEAGVALKPSSRGRRLKRSAEGVRVIDGPFAESKELLAGYVILAVDSLDEATDFALRYFEVVQTDEVDIRELV